MTANY